MFSDRKLSVTVLLAWLLWAVVAAGMTLGVAVDIEWLRDVALAASAMAATMHIRSFMCVFSERMKAAFELGRQVEREQQRSRDLHSI